jgi:hypothetical protein
VELASSFAVALLILMSLVGFALRARLLGLGINLSSYPSRRCLQLSIMPGPLGSKLLFELPSVKFPSLIGNPPSCSGGEICDAGGDKCGYRSESAYDGLNLDAGIPRLVLAPVIVDHAIREAQGHKD